MTIQELESKIAKLEAGLASKATPEAMKFQMQRQVSALKAELQKKKNNAAPAEVKEEEPKKKDEGKKPTSKNPKPKRDPKPKPEPKAEMAVNMDVEDCKKAISDSIRAQKEAKLEAWKKKKLAEARAAGASGNKLTEIEEKSYNDVFGSNKTEADKIVDHYISIVKIKAANRYVRIVGKKESATSKEVDLVKKGCTSAIASNKKGLNEDLKFIVVSPTKHLARFKEETEAITENLVERVENLVPKKQAA